MFGNPVLPHGRLPCMPSPVRQTASFTPRHRVMISGCIGSAMAASIAHATSNWQGMTFKQRRPAKNRPLTGRA